MTMRKSTQTTTKLRKRLTRAASEGIPSSIDIKFLEFNDNPYITAAHIHQNEGRGVCLAVGIDLSTINPDTRTLRQDNCEEEMLLICSNLLMAFYQSRDIGDYRYAYTMRDQIQQQYNLQSKDKGIFLHQLTFFRDGESEGFRMVESWKCDVLLIPGWKGVQLEYLQLAAYQKISIKTVEK